MCSIKKLGDCLLEKLCSRIWSLLYFYVSTIKVHVIYEGLKNENLKTQEGLGRLYPGIIEARVAIYCHQSFLVVHMAWLSYRDKIYIKIDCRIFVYNSLSKKWMTFFRATYGSILSTSESWKQSLKVKIDYSFHRKKNPRSFDKNWRNESLICVQWIKSSLGFRVKVWVCTLGLTQWNLNCFEFIFDDTRLSS